MVQCVVTVAGKFCANPFGSFCEKLITEKQTDKQRRLHILLGRGNNWLVRDPIERTV